MCEYFAGEVYVVLITCFQLLSSSLAVLSVVILGQGGGCEF